ncbi:MAG: ankyrin repeat domain-containing protein [Longimicrobiales bacterium]|nr:ankyrin repeat domain-containing protein [Longimicrobiales bacterium]
MRRLPPLGALAALVPALLLATPLAPLAAQSDAPVARAAAEGDVQEVRTLLRQGADVNAALGDGMSALHWAADRGDTDLMEVLITAGAVLESSTRIGEYRPLHIAARNGHPEAVAMLVEAGADVEARTDPSGSTALHLGATSGHPEVVRILIDAGAEPDAREAEWAQTPLIFAAAWNRVAAIHALIDGGADPNLAAETMDLEVMRRYDQAAERRRSEVLKAFTNDGEWSPTSAQIQAAVRAARQVYEGDPPPPREESDRRRMFRANIDAFGGLTPLLQATRQGHVEAIEALLDRGAEIDQPGGGDDTTPLLIATINGQFDAAMLLLERGADPNLASSANGVTPLFATINSEWQPRTRYPQPQERAQQRYGYIEMAEALLEAGADPDARLTLHPWYMEYTGCGNFRCGLIDMNGATAFLRAAYATDVEAMRLLHAWGADPFVATKAPERRRRMSPEEMQRAFQLDLLADADSFAIMSDSARAMAVVTIWRDLPDSVKADLSEEDVRADADEYREIVLEHAQRQDSVKAAEPDPSGLPPVPVGGPAVYAIHAASGVGYGEGFAGNAHRHADHGWLPSVKFLVEEVGMDVNLRDHNGYTAMHHAAARGDNELILYLVEQGGDVTAMSRRGQTTADMANGPVSRVSPIPETVALLESLGSENSNNCLTCE